MPVALLVVTGGQGSVTNVQAFLDSSCTILHAQKSIKIRMIPA